MWKRLKHPNIVGFIGVTRRPLQFVSEWMPNGTLTEYLDENPGANRIGLVGLSSAIITSLGDNVFSQVIGCRRGSHLSSCNPHNTWRLKGGRFFFLWFKLER